MATFGPPWGPPWRTPRGAPRPPPRPPARPEIPEIRIFRFFRFSGGGDFWPPAGSPDIADFPIVNDSEGGYPPKWPKIPEIRVSHFVPTGRVIKYPPKCAPRAGAAGAPGPVPPRGAPPPGGTLGKTGPVSRRTAKMAQIPPKRIFFEKSVSPPQLAGPASPSRHRSPVTAPRLAEVPLGRSFYAWERMTNSAISLASRTPRIWRSSVLDASGCW